MGVGVGHMDRMGLLNGASRAGEGLEGLGETWMTSEPFLKV